MDAEEIKPGIIALIMFIVYTALVFERLYRESRKAKHLARAEEEDYERRIHH